MDFSSSSLGHAINGTNWALWILAAIAVILRFVALSKRSTTSGLGDYIMLFSLIINLINASVSSVAVANGIGTPITEVAPFPASLSAAIYWSNLSTVFGLLGLSFPKLAVALLVNKVFVPKPAMKTLNLSIAGLLVALILVCCITLYQQCTPVAHQWDPSVPGTCWSPHVFASIGTAAGSWDCFTDVWFIVYPTFVITRLRMPLRKKIVACVAMGLGVFTLFTTLYKTAAILPQLTERDSDITYISGLVILWTAIEANVTVIAGSIPTWGWLIKVDSLERFVTWISLHSTRRSKSSERLGSAGQEFQGHNQIETLSDRRPAKKEQIVDSIDLLERSAAR